jgi:hypothetical protein
MKAQPNFNFWQNEPKFPTVQELPAAAMLPRFTRFSSTYPTFHSTEVETSVWTGGPAVWRCHIPESKERPRHHNPTRRNLLAGSSRLAGSAGWMLEECESGGLANPPKTMSRSLSGAICKASSACSAVSRISPTFCTPRGTDSHSWQRTQRRAHGR